MRRVCYTDWHRVERAVLLISLQVSELEENGWLRDATKLSFCSGVRPSDLYSALRALDPASYSGRACGALALNRDVYSTNR